MCLYNPADDRPEMTELGAKSYRVAVSSFHVGMHRRWIVTVTPGARALVKLNSPGQVDNLFTVQSELWA